MEINSQDNKHWEAAFRGKDGIFRFQGVPLGFNQEKNSLIFEGKDGEYVELFCQNLLYIRGSKAVRDFLSDLIDCGIMPEAGPTVKSRAKKTK